jgi:predicted neuraminidase
MRLFVLKMPSLFFMFATSAAFAEPVFTTENIFPQQNLHCHSSSIVECPNGDLLACWFYGTGERTADDVIVQGARLQKGTETWSEPFLMADSQDLADCNPVLFIDRNEKLWLFWISVLARRWECGMLKYRTSTDYQGEGAPNWDWQDVIVLKPGEAFAEEVESKLKEMNYPEGTWAEYARPYPEQLIQASKDPYKRQTGWMPRVHPLTLPSGRVVLPLYSDGFNLSLMAISDDDGATWHASRPIVGSGPQQPSLILRSDGAVVAYMRDTGDAPGRIQLSVSNDEGESWSIPVDLDIPNPDSSVEVIALKSGNWLLVCNDTEDSRAQLTAYVSGDEGKTWKWRRQIEPSDDEGESFSYPSVIQTRDGLIHLTYTYKGPKGNTIRHTVLDEAWLLQTK